MPASFGLLKPFAADSYRCTNPQRLDRVGHPLIRARGPGAFAGSSARSRARTARQQDAYFRLVDVRDRATSTAWRPPELEFPAGVARRRALRSSAIFACDDHRVGFKVPAQARGRRADRPGRVRDCGPELDRRARRSRPVAATSGASSRSTPRSTRDSLSAGSMPCSPSSP
jgi:hypothetical protein